MLSAAVVRDFFKKLRLGLNMALIDSWLIKKDIGKGLWLGMNQSLEVRITKAD